MKILCLSSIPLMPDLIILMKLFSAHPCSFQDLDVPFVHQDEDVFAGSFSPEQQRSVFKPPWCNCIIF